MRIQDLINVSLNEAGINFLISLPEPHKSPLKNANLKDLLESCKTFRRLWGELLIDGVNLPHVELKDLPKDMVVPETDEEIWDSLFLTITHYYNYSFFRYAENEKHTELPEGLNLSTIEKFIPKNVENIDYKYVLRVTSFDYFTCLVTLYFYPILRNMPGPPSARNQFITSYHNSIYSLYRHSIALSSQKKYACLNLTNSVLKYASAVFSKIPTNKEYKPGIFSAIKTEELSLLASRDSEIAKQYGIKSIEKVFERQLALIMQSLGMYVISTRTGTKTVDLICISPFPDQQYTFMVEAKTTNKPYSLPRKDFRALKEYIDDVRRTLHTLPPLRFVIISAFQSSKTLENKLRELQAETGIAIRFISSQQIADLRENIIGQLPSDIFLDKVLLSPVIIEDSFVTEIQKKHIAMQKAHTDFVNTIFNAKGIISPSSEHKFKKP